MATQSVSSSATSGSNTPHTAPTISTHDPTQPLLILNLANHSTIKLTSTNYLSWQQQFTSLLIGYDLQGYVDSSLLSNPLMIDVNGISSPNPAYSLWHHQDRLVFTALLGSLSAPIAPLLHRATTSREAWLILANTYAKPSRGHIKQIKDQLKNPLQGTQTTSEFMQHVRTRADQLAILGKPMDDEDLVEKILDGLDPHTSQSLMLSMHATRQLLLMNFMRSSSIESSLFDLLPHYPLFRHQQILLASNTAIAPMPHSLSLLLSLGQHLRRHKLLARHHVHTWATIKDAVYKDIALSNVPNTAICSCSRRLSSTLLNLNPMALVSLAPAHHLHGNQMFTIHLLHLLLRPHLLHHGCLIVVRLTMLPWTSATSPSIPHIMIKMTS